jgi:hypothetical protein
LGDLSEEDLLDFISRPTRRSRRDLELLGDLSDPEEDLGDLSEEDFGDLSDPEEDLGDLYDQDLLDFS